MMVCGLVSLGLVILMAAFRRRDVWQKIRSPCLAVFLFGLLGLLAGVLGEAKEKDGSYGTITRNAPGEGELETEVYAYLPQEDTEYMLTLLIPERAYGKKEEQALLAAAEEEIKETFYGANEITSDPDIRESYQDGAVTADWRFLDRTFISAEGKVDMQALKKSGQTKQRVEAEVILSCGTSEKTCRFAFVIAPDPTTPKENLAFGIEKQIAGQEKTERKVVLPTNVNGREICWKDPGQNLPFQLLGLGVLAAAAVFCAEKERRETEKQKRKQRLFLAYPEFVSTLSLLLGAGMTISGALRKMDSMYCKRKTEGGRAQDGYEELHVMICEIDNGVGELRAYEQFCGRCGLQPYRKLVSLLASGQRVGNSRLLEQLDEEAGRVFSERKNAAKRLGEEAGTKLLLPMMMMLLVVMGIVMVPAFLSVYGL